MFGWFAHNSTSPSRSGRARLRLEALEDRTVPSADPLEPQPSDPPPPTEATVAPPVEPPADPSANAPPDAPPALPPSEPTPSGEEATTEPIAGNPWDEWTEWTEWTEDDWLVYWLEEAEYTDWSEYLPDDVPSGDGADFAPEESDEAAAPTGAAPTETLTQRQERLLRDTLDTYPDLKNQLEALKTSAPTKFAQVQEQLRQAFEADKSDDENRSNLREVLEGAFPAAQPPDTAPAPRAREGTLADQQKWAKEAVDYLAQSAAKKAAAIEALKKQIPTDQADRATWLRYYEKRLIPNVVQFDVDPVSREQAAVNQRYVQMLRDPANFVVGANGIPVAITEAGKAKMRELADLVKQFAEYRAKPTFDKVVEALRYARDSGLLDAEMTKRVDEFLKPENLAIFSAFVGVGLGATLLGGPVAVFVGGFAMGLLGASVLDVSRDLVMGVEIARGALGPDDIKVAAEHLARGLSKAAEQVLLVGGGVATGRAIQLLRGKSATQRADGRVEVVDNPALTETPAQRAARLLGNSDPARQNMRTTLPDEGALPPRDITPAPQPATSTAGQSAVSPPPSQPAPAATTASPSGTTAGAQSTTTGSAQTTPTSSAPAQQPVSPTAGSTSGAPATGSTIPAKVTNTLATVQSTNAAPPGYVGGRQFLNDGRGGGQALPRTAADGTPIAYREWDVNPRVPGVNRGAERLVTGSDGKAYLHERSLREVHGDQMSHSLRQPILSATASGCSRLVATLSDATDVLLALQQGDFRRTVRHLRGKRMRTTEQMYHEFAAVLQFPYYFGGNWGAFDECLADLSWLPATAYVITVLDCAELLRDEPDEQIEQLFSVLETISGEWSKPVSTGQAWDRPGVPFHVLFQHTLEDAGRLQKRIASLPQLSVEAT
jgi:hypothetical protein